MSTTSLASWWAVTQRGASTTLLEAVVGKGVPAPPAIGDGERRGRGWRVRISHAAANHAMRRSRESCVESDGATGGVRPLSYHAGRVAGGCVERG